MGGAFTVAVLDPVRELVRVCAVLLALLLQRLPLVTVEIIVDDIPIRWIWKLAVTIQSLD